MAKVAETRILVEPMKMKSKSKHGSHVMQKQMGKTQSVNRSAESGKQCFRHPAKEQLNDDSEEINEKIIPLSKEQVEIIRAFSRMTVSEKQTLLKCKATVQVTGQNAPPPLKEKLRARGDTANWRDDSLTDSTIPTGTNQVSSVGVTHPVPTPSGNEVAQFNTSIGHDFLSPYSEPRVEQQLQDFANIEIPTDEDMNVIINNILGNSYSNSGGDQSEQQNSQSNCSPEAGSLDLQATPETRSQGVQTTPELSANGSTVINVVNNLPVLLIVASNSLDVQQNDRKLTRHRPILPRPQ